MTESGSSTKTITSTLKHKKKDYNTLWGYFEQDIKWLSVIFLFSIHLWFTYISLFVLPNRSLWRIIVFQYFYSMLFSGFGVTGGAHRYFTHKCYKAKLPLRIILVLAYSAASQNSLYNWVRDHRVHHKFSETDADPHNSKRGFFFSHVGWFMLKKHPEVLRKGKNIDCNDILEDPLVRFHQKYYYFLIFWFGHIFPSLLGCYMFNHTFYDSFQINFFRWVVQLNVTWSVNSVAHLWGSKPYDKTIGPVETKFVAFMTFGEGWHNYHHTFPWDYRASEWNYYINPTTLLIDMFAKIGWAYDLKQPSEDLIKASIEKQGDGSHFKWGSNKK